MYFQLSRFDFISASATVKIVMNFLQILRTHLMYEMKWPKVFKDFTSIFGFVQFDFTDMTAPSCAYSTRVDYFTSFTFYMALIPFELFVCAVHYAIYTHWVVKIGTNPWNSPSASEQAERILKFRAKCSRNALWVSWPLCFHPAHPATPRSLFSFFLRRC